MWQWFSGTPPALLSVITLAGRRFVARLHPAGAFAPDQEGSC